jgi:hypothetical protein
VTARGCGWRLANTVAIIPRVDFGVRVLLPRLYDLVAEPAPQLDKLKPEMAHTAAA